MKILDMNDFEVYIHKLALDECDEEEVYTVPGETIIYFEDEWDGDCITDLLRQLFGGLDMWRRDGNLNRWCGTSYIKSILEFIGHPALHGKLVSNLDDDIAEGEDW